MRNLIFFLITKIVVFESKRLELKKSRSHGTGCALASAISAELANGKSLEGAVFSAKVYLCNYLMYGLDSYACPANDRESDLVLKREIK